METANTGYEDYLQNPVQPALSTLVCKSSNSMMNIDWYISRIKKMPFREIFKRLREIADVYMSFQKYRNPEKWPYERFAKDYRLQYHTLPGFHGENDWWRYKIFNQTVNLSERIDWAKAEHEKSWPQGHYSKINYRPGNPYGDIRLSWEIHRMQFLPSLSIDDEELAKAILIDWLDNNPYQHGTGYVSSMEVALRWISIYWAACLFKNSPGKILERKLTGLAIASGRYIESRLSTFSSAGNHLIIEAVGLFWIGKSLSSGPESKKWISLARELISREAVRQLNPDGTNKEQSFWYLGFVIDALLHYFLLEDRDKILDPLWRRVESALDYLHLMILPDGGFPDYGDRDDGMVFRSSGTYDEPPFAGLLNTGADFFNRPEWKRDLPIAKNRARFWCDNNICGDSSETEYDREKDRSLTPSIKTFYDGGITLMKWDKSRLYFFHGILGLEPTFGHGHAHALSVLLYYRSTPVLVDLGSGQYSGDPEIRNFFRSTLAHNTIEVEHLDQSKMLGAFLWDKSYEAQLVFESDKSGLIVEACQNGYEQRLGVTHKRRVEWLEPTLLKILDFFEGQRGAHCRGAFHLGACHKVTQRANLIEAYFDDFTVVMSFPASSNPTLFFGSYEPFIGWRSTIYGKWEAIYSILFEFESNTEHEVKIRLHR